MIDVMTKYYEVIKRTSGALYQMFDGEKITHTELIEEADRILPKTLRNPNARQLPEYATILGCVVELYEAEVGIKTFAPTTIAKDKQSKYLPYLHQLPHFFLLLLKELL